MHTDKTPHSWMQMESESRMSHSWVLGRESKRCGRERQTPYVWTLVSVSVSMKTWERGSLMSAQHPLGWQKYAMSKASSKPLWSVAGNLRKIVGTGCDTLYQLSKQARLPNDVFLCLDWSNRSPLPGPTMMT